jgi:hypothetical protein
MRLPSSSLLPASLSYSAHLQRFFVSADMSLRELENSYHLCFMNVNSYNKKQNKQTKEGGVF